MGNFIWSSPQRSFDDCCLLARQGEVSEEDFRVAVARCTPKKASELSANDILYGICAKSGQVTAYTHPVSQELTFKMVKSNIAGVSPAESKLIKHLLVNTLSANSVCRNVVIMIKCLFPHAGEVEKVCGEILALSVPFPGAGKRGAWITEYIKKQEAARSGGGACACGGTEENVCSCPCAAGEKCSCKCPEGCPCECPCGKERKCSCISGGVELAVNDLAKYAETVVSASNIKFIDTVLEVGRKMGMNITGETHKAMVQSFLKQIPSISGNPANCKRLGEAVNDAVGQKVIDTDMNPGAICQQVNTIMSSWGGAMTGELVGAYADLCKILSNTAFVINVLEKITEGLERDLAPVKEIEVRLATTEKIELIKSFVKQLRGLNLSVQGLVNAHVNPALLSLKSLAASTAGIGHVVKMGDFTNDQLAKYAQDALRLKGMHAAQAVLIETALKNIGLTMKEYIATVNAKRLSEITNKVVEKNKGLNLTPEQLETTLEAIKTLETFASKITSGELTEYLENHKEGGAGSAPQYASRTEDKRVENERKFKRMIFVAFYRRLNEQLDDFEKRLDEIAKKVGAEIPVDDCLNDLTEAIKKINYEVIRKKDSYLAITGYHNDAHSKSIRDNLLMDFNFFIKEIELCMSKPALASATKHLVGARDAARALVETIETYTRDIAARSGETYSGGNDESTGLESLRGIGTKIAYKSPYEKDKTIRRFDYNIKLAALKENLKRQGQDVAFYAEKYDDFVAKSVARYLDDERKAGEEDEKRAKEYFDKNALTAHNPAIVAAARRPKQPNGAPLTGPEIFKDIKTLLRDQRNVKQNFWATVEAIDKYMQLFAAGMMNNPDDIGDISKMLDNVQALRSFYTDDTPEKIREVFRAFTEDGLADGSGYFVTPNRFSGVIEKMKDAMISFGTLKNLISVFSRVASKFGGVDIGSRVFMSPGRMYTNLMNFIIYAALGQPYGNQLGQTIGNQLGELDPLTRTCIKLRRPHEGRYDTNIALSPALRFGGHDVFGKGGSDHEMFVMVIKSMCAKILTVLGLHAVFEKPLNVPAYHKINNIRMIIGGADTIPQINEPAIELYMRLPLLCQFYKNLFKYDKDNIKTPTPPSPADLHINDKQAAMISFVPDIDGVFSGLIRMIFRKVNFDDPAAYSNEDIMEIIRECNSIYQKLEKKHTTNTINGIINDLVSEINRRYGIVTEKSRELYEKEHGFRYDYDVGTLIDPYEEDSTRTIKLLDGEGEENPPMSGAQKLIATSAAASDPLRQANIGLSQTHITLINRFRARIDRMLVQPTAEDFNFREVIKATKSRVALEPSNDKKFELVCRMMRSSHMLTDGDSTKYMMAHETIVAGLNTLSGIHSILRRYIDIVVALDPKYVKDFIPGHSGSPPKNNMPAIAQSFQFGYNEFVTRIKGTSAGYLIDELFYTHTPEDQWRPNGESDGYTDRFSAPKKTTTGAIVGNGRRGVENAYRLVLTIIFEISNSFGGLVQMSFTKGKLHLNFGGLRSKITEMLESISYFINQARPFLSKADLKRFTDKFTPGSLYWFREQLYEKMIVGRASSAAPSGKRIYVTLDRTPQILSNIIEKLSSCTWACSAFADEIFFPQNYITEAPAPKAVVFTSAIGALHLVGNPIGKRYVDARYIWDYEFCKIDDQDYNRTRSLLFSFNQTIAKFISTFYDTAVGKIYVGLLDKFCNGLFAGDIRDIGKTFPDMHPGKFTSRTAKVEANTIPWEKYLSQEFVPGNETDDVPSVTPSYKHPFNLPGAPVKPSLRNTLLRYPSEGNQILFMSLAHILNNLYSTKNSTLQVTYTYLIDNVADIPHSVREKMRANLPVFRELFESIAKKCSMIREIFDAFEPAIQLSDADQPVSTYVCIYPFPNYTGIGDKNTGADTRNAILPSIRKIESGCQIFMDICDTVLKEIGDTATYFETHQGSVKDFISKYNTAPFNPLSMLLATYRNADSRSDTDFLPFFEMGDTRFKFAYGTRKLLHSQDIKLDHMPFMGQLLQQYNSLARTPAVIDARKYEEHCINMVSLIRYVYNMRHNSVILRSCMLGGRLAKFPNQVHANSFAGLPFIVNKAPRDDVDKFAWRMSDTTMTLGVPHQENNWFATNKSDYSLYKYDAGQSVRDGPKFVSYMNLPLGAIVEQIEDPNVDKRVYEIAERMTETHLGQSAEQLWTMNILDLGIIPISVHAMQRFIPLANVINYAYSFDKLICELVYGYGYSKTQDLMEAFDSKSKHDKADALFVQSALDALVMSVLNPFAEMQPGQELYYTNMLRGATTVEGLDRGKFLYELLQVVLKMGSGNDPKKIGNPIPSDIYGQWQRVSHHGGSFMGHEMTGGDTTMADMNDTAFGTQNFGAINFTGDPIITKDDEVTVHGKNANSGHPFDGSIDGQNRHIIVADLHKGLSAQWGKNDTGEWVTIGRSLQPQEGPEGPPPPYQPAVAPVVNAQGPPVVPVTQPQKPSQAPLDYKIAKITDFKSDLQDAMRNENKVFRSTKKYLVKKLLGLREISNGQQLTETAIKSYEDITKDTNDNFSQLLDQITILGWMQLTAGATIVADNDDDQEIIDEYYSYFISPSPGKKEMVDALNYLFKLTASNIGQANWSLILADTGLIKTFAEYSPLFLLAVYDSGVNAQLLVRGGAFGQEMNEKDRKIFVTHVVNFILDHRDVKIQNIIDYADHVTSKILHKADAEKAVIEFITYWTIACAVQASEVRAGQNAKQIFDNLISNIGLVVDSNLVLSPNHNALRRQIITLVTVAFEGRKVDSVRVITDKGNYVNNRFDRGINDNYDTYFCRELVFIQNAYRLVQLAIRRSMAHSDENIIEGSIIAAEPHTEFFNRASSKGTLLYEGMDGSWNLNKKK
jgi:hypothetical protein